MTLRQFLCLLLYLTMRKTTPAIHQCDTGRETNRHPKAFEGPCLFTAIAARVILIVKQQETPTETSGQVDSTPQTRAKETPAGALEVPFARKAGQDPRPAIAVFRAQAWYLRQNPRIE